jgi:hypothetical protein
MNYKAIRDNGDKRGLASMTIINLTPNEIEAISGIDLNALQAAIDRETKTESQAGVENIVSFRCSAFIQQRLRYFKVALQDFYKARSPKKREETHQDAMRKGGDLLSAVSQMQDRVVIELRQRELFTVDDQIQPPIEIRDAMSVRVFFNWRNSKADEWQNGSIRFEYLARASLERIIHLGRSGKLTAKQQRKRERELHSIWEHLRLSALCSVRDFFVQGGNGEAIPPNFKVVPDQYTGGLNNYSTQFWRLPT